MSNESDIREPRVSETYREIATETTPAHLDRRVLEAARAGARTRYGLARAWMRPLAWAATIALSFAFVLEVTRDADVPATAEIPVRADRTDSAPPAASAGDDSRELHESSGEAIMRAKELSDRAVSQAPARAAPEPAPMMLNGTASRGAIPETCDSKARASAETWYECVEALRALGLAEAAEAELEALQAEFPDFRVPVAN